MEVKIDLISITLSILSVIGAAVALYIALSKEKK